MLKVFFFSEYASNISGVYKKNFVVDQGEYLLNLKDTNQFTPEDIKYNTLWSDAIVIVYSDSDITSLRYF